MIYEVNTGKSINNLKRCDYCKHNVGYLLRDKDLIECNKFNSMIYNNKSKCKYNEFQNSEVDNIE